MHFLVCFLFALTVTAFGIPQMAQRAPNPSPTPTVTNGPCSVNNQQMYPHRIRRSLHSGVLDSRQFIEPHLGGQKPPAPKYVISQALIQQGPFIGNTSYRQFPERVEIIVANVSTPASQAKCEIDWDTALAGNDKTGYQFQCENNAYCVILQQQASAPEKGFYIYVALPNTMNTQVAWQVKNLATAPGWTPIGSAGTDTQHWGDWYFNGTAPLNQNPGVPLSQFTDP